MRKARQTAIHFSTLAILLISLLSQPGSTMAKQQSSDVTGWVRFTPSVIWCGDTVKAEFHAVGSNNLVNDIVRVDLYDNWFTTKAVLYDHGLNGDLVAGDKVFTAENVQSNCKSFAVNYVNGLAGTVPFSADVWLNETHNPRILPRVNNVLGIEYELGVVDPSLKGVFQVHDFGNGLTATSHAFFIEDSQHEVMDNYPVANVYCGTSNFNAYRKLYSVLPDAFDFASVMPGLKIYKPQTFQENVPYSAMASNAVRQIGVRVFDNSAKFGSAGRLKTTIYHSFGSIAIMDHEIGHTWGVNIGSSLGLIDQGGHHFVNLSDLGGQLGAYYLSPGYFDNPTVVDPSRRAGHFADNGDGTWRLIPNTEIVAYSPLELYVMGLIPAGEVPPIHILESPDLTDIEHITAKSVRTITIEDIIRVEGGERTPSVAESQKDFSMAFIVTQDVAYNDAAYAFFSVLSMELMSKGGPDKRTTNAPFYWATGGRATLNTRLPIDLPEPAFPQATASALPPTEAFASTPTESPPTPESKPSEQSAPSGLGCATLPAVLALSVSGLTWRRKRNK